MAGTTVLCDAAVCSSILARTDATTAFKATFEVVGPSTLRARRVE